MFNQTVVVVRAAALTEETGAEAVQRDWANATRTTYGGCNVQPQVTDEAEDSTGIRTAARWLLHRPGHMDLMSTDRVEYAGMTLEVVGVPKQWPTPEGGWHHTEVILAEESLFRASSGQDALAATRTAATGAASRTWSPR